MQHFELGTLIAALVTTIVVALLLRRANQRANARRLITSLESYKAASQFPILWRSYIVKAGFADIKSIDKLYPLLGERAAWAFEQNIGIKPPSAVARAMRQALGEKV